MENNKPVHAIRYPNPQQQKASSLSCVAAMETLAEDETFGLFT